MTLIGEKIADDHIVAQENQSISLVAEKIIDEIGQHNPSSLFQQSQDLLHGIVVGTRCNLRPNGKNVNGPYCFR